MTWIKATDGSVTGSGNFNAVLRTITAGSACWRPANDGVAGGKQILPRDYLLEASQFPDWRTVTWLPPRRARPRQPYFGYGYQFWLFPGEKRRFALLGIYGQSIRSVDPLNSSSSW